MTGPSLCVRPVSLIFPPATGTRLGQSSRGFLPLRCPKSQAHSAKSSTMLRFNWRRETCPSAMLRGVEEMGCGQGLSKQGRRSSSPPCLSGGTTPQPFRLLPPMSLRSSARPGYQVAENGLPSYSAGRSLVGVSWCHTRWVGGISRAYESCCELQVSFFCPSTSRFSVESPACVEDGQTLNQLRRQSWRSL